MKNYYKIHFYSLSQQAFYGISTTEGGLGAVQAPVQPDHRLLRKHDVPEPSESSGSHRQPSFTARQAGVIADSQG